MTEPSLQEVLAKFPQVKPGELEISTGPDQAGTFIRVKHLPTGKTRGARRVAPHEYRELLHRLVEDLLAEVAAAR